MEKEKLDKYLRANGGLTSKQGTKFLIWSFFNFKKCLYFYQLCEEGTSNFVAFNRADRASSQEINLLLRNKGYELQ